MLFFARGRGVPGWRKISTSMIAQNANKSNKTRKENPRRDVRRGWKKFVLNSWES
jgi:hypothetical protein